ERHTRKRRSRRVLCVSRFPSAIVLLRAHPWDFSFDVGRPETLTLPSPSGRGDTSFFVGVDQLLSNVFRGNPVGTGFQRVAHFVEALGAGLLNRVGQLVQFFCLGRQGQRIRASGSLAVFSRIAR